jgi:hypothetical protein
METTMTDISTTVSVPAGIAEIAEHFSVSKSAVTNWVARNPDFPEPIIELRMGKVWDLDLVVDWYNEKWAE